MKTFEAKILTPDGPVFKGMVESINLPGTQGNFQVLANHAALMSALDTGEIRINDGSKKDILFAVSVGFVEVNENQVTILAESAESPDRIDLQRAIEAKKRAEERLKATNDDSIDHIRAEAALKRAINRLNLAKVLSQ
jgi:F-type H+-transporting ATPase subunit epsilon